MIRPNLVDHNIYNKLKKKIIKNANDQLSYKFNIGIILFIIFILTFIYYIYLEKKIKKEYTNK